MSPAARKAFVAAQRARIGNAPKGYEAAFVAGMLEAARLCNTEICPSMVSTNQMHEIADTIEAHASDCKA